MPEKTVFALCKAITWRIPTDHRKSIIFDAGEKRERAIESCQESRLFQQKRKQAKENPSGRNRRGFQIKPGAHLLSHPLAGAVPSALEGFTSGFGMGPGVSPLNEAPDIIISTDGLA